MSLTIYPAQGGVIIAEPTFWSAWGTQALTNLGHVSNFAFGFLVGKGCANMAIGAGSAAVGASIAGEAVTTFGKTFAKDFAMTAKDNFVQQFTGWNQGGLFCRFMKGFGLYGEVKAHYDIWTDDEKSTWEKVKESGMSLILDVFAAKGAKTVCFPAGTKVHTQWGLADIEKLEVGVPVLTYNEETGRQEYKKVKKVMRRMTRRMCAMELSNGTILEVTPEHRFFSNGKWTPIEELNVNDTLQLKDNSIVVIDNKIIFPTFVEVYNLEIEDNENYYVTEEGVLVHNGYGEKSKIGENGTQTSSTTTWQEGKTERIDVENPSLGIRDGQIHYHDANNKKYMYDIEKGTFEGLNKRLKQLLKNDKFCKGIEKAKNIRVISMIKMNHKMVTLLCTAKSYDNGVLQRVCIDILSKIKQIYDCIIYDENEAVNNMITDRDITEKYGDKTAFEMWYNEIRLSSYSKFDEGYILPFLNIIGKTLASKYSKQFCYIIYITNTQDIDFRFHIYRKEEGLWLDENIEQDPNPLLYELL